MPIYEFVCADCGHEFESLQRLNDAPPANCPKCSGGSISKKISAAGFRLKGGGWYETDFKNKSKKKGDGGAASGSSDSGSGSSSGSSGSSGSSDSSSSSSGNSGSSSGSSE